MLRGMIFKVYLPCLISLQPRSVEAKNVDIKFEFGKQGFDVFNQKRCTGGGFYKGT